MAGIKDWTAWDTLVEFHHHCDNWDFKPSVPNAGGMARELAAQDSDNTTDING